MVKKKVWIVGDKISEGRDVFVVKNPALSGDYGE